jgi:hypothetical protein
VPELWKAEERKDEAFKAADQLLHRPETVPKRTDFRAERSLTAAYKASSVIKTIAADPDVAVRLSPYG